MPSHRDSLRSRPTDKLYREQYDLIYGKDSKEESIDPNKWEVSSQSGKTTYRIKKST